MKITDKFESIPGVYVITNTINGKCYVGETINIHERFLHHKLCNKQTIHKAVKKYGILNFDVYVEYLPDLKKDDLIALEEQLIIKFNSMAPHGYNITPKGTHNNGYKHTEEAKEKIRLSSTGRKHSVETKQKLSKIKMGKKLPPLSEEHKQKLLAANKGSKRPKTKEHMEKLCAANRGKKLSEEHKRKISESNNGKIRPPVTEEWRRKQSLAHKGRVSPNKGKTASLETREKISLSHKGLIPSEESRLKRSISMKRIWELKKLQKITSDS
jgi:group I intron endonuclease